MFVAKYVNGETSNGCFPHITQEQISVFPGGFASHDGVVIGRVTGTGIIGDTVINSVNESDDIYVAKFSSDGSWTEVQHSWRARF